MASFDIVYAASIVGLCTLLYLGFIFYVLAVSIRNKYKLDIYILMTFGFIGISMSLWFFDYFLMALHTPESKDELFFTYYLDPFFLF